MNNFFFNLWCGRFELIRWPCLEISHSVLFVTLVLLGSCSTCFYWFCIIDKMFPAIEPSTILSRNSRRNILVPHVIVSESKTRNLKHWIFCHTHKFLRLRLLFLSNATAETFNVKIVSSRCLYCFFSLLIVVMWYLFLC